ncbi:MAG: glycosyltransferase [Acidimicrobiales bacterium]
MANLPLISAIIPAFNAATFLSQAIESVLRQTYFHVECIVVDDGSTDDTPRLLASYGDSVRVFRQENNGVAAARNLGATLARGELLAFLDADDEWKPDRLARQVPLFATYPSLGVVYTGLEYMDAMGRCLRTQKAPKRSAALRNTLLMEPPHIPLAQGALVRRTTFEATGGFDDALSTAADCDLACRLTLAAPVAPVDEPLTRYRVHSGQMYENLDALQHDMVAVFGKIFRDPRLPAELRPLYGRARANLEYTLGTSYARRGQVRTAVRHLQRGFTSDPRRFAYLVTRSRALTGNARPHRRAGA